MMDNDEQPQTSNHIPNDVNITSEQQQQQPEQTTSI